MATGVYEFVADTSGTTNLAHDERIALLVACIALQQAAGFGHCLDARQFACPDCKAPGFNTGWGSVRFVCQAAWVGDEVAEPCRAEARH